MFVLTTIADTVRIPPSMFVHPVLQSVHLEIEKKFPNRVLMDVGLVICRYGDALEIGDGVCVAGDGGAHHECVFRMVIFRPFVEEVCIGTIVESNEEGIRVSLGEFFDQVHIPAYWMLRPSHFNHHSSLWIWTPQYDDDDDEEEEDDNEDTNDKDNDENNDKDENKDKDNIDNDENNDKDNKGNIDKDDKDSIDKDNGENNEEEKQADANQFEMYIGAEIRFKVKAINFTQVTNTAKGVQATTTTTSHSNAAKMAGPLDTAASTNLNNNNNNNNNKDGTNNNKNKSSTDDTSSKPLRKRSTSVDLSDAQRIPATMHITASICEDGLGLTSWWKSTADEEDEENEEQGDEGEEEQADNEENEQHGEPE